MAESQFSWFKVASFVGATLLAVICFVAVAAGFNLYHEGQSLYGVMCVVAGLLSGAFAVMVYKNYQKKSREQ